MIKSISMLFIEQASLKSVYNKPCLINIVYGFGKSVRTPNLGVLLKKIKCEDTSVMESESYEP